MKRFIVEDDYFRITVVDGKRNAQGGIDCRNGHEIGDCYVCAYGCPEPENGVGSFCSKTMLKLFPLQEAVRAGGDLRRLGGESATQYTFGCPDGVVFFRLEAEKNHRR
jgi:uncharacterized repeat protein (TIGR04076 family)